MTSSAKTALLFVGTYTTNNDSEGIYTYRFDLESGSLKKLHSGPKTASPSFLATNAAGTVLYAVNETETGEVTSFTVDPADASLTVQSTQKSMGVHPCGKECPHRELHQRNSDITWSCNRWKPQGWNDCTAAWNRPGQGAPGSSTCALRKCRSQWQVGFSR